VIHEVRQAALGHDCTEPADVELLDRYVGLRDEAAFEALLRRHGPMVLGVCRRILANSADAEDAFQATFLVLIRKAGTIRPPGLVSNWLFGVARNTALKARAMIHKRQAKEKEAGAQPKTPVCLEAWQQVQALLDEELSRLPDKYRVPLVLCDLEGMTAKEAARHLGWPEGTVTTRLGRGRRMLAKRLTGHGITFSAGALAALLAQNAAFAGVPAPLFAATMKIAACSSLISIPVATLTEGVLKAMFLHKLKTVTTALVLACALLVGGLITLNVALGQTPSSPQQTARADPEIPVADQQPDKQADESNEMKRTFAVEQMKKNLDAVSNFTCRYTIYHCSAPTVEDALLDRNVKRIASWHGMWIVRKPAERFLVVTSKGSEVLDQPINRSLGPIDLAGFFEDQKIGEKIRSNYLWTGELGLSVHYSLKIGNVWRDFGKGTHNRTPGTPAEGEIFDYRAPDRRLSSFGEYKASFVGLGTDGGWKIHQWKGGEQPIAKITLDPKRGFLPTNITYWCEYFGGPGYCNWYATHFEKVGPDNWFPVRSVDIYPPGLIHTTNKQGERVPSKDLHFREFKAERFDWKTPVTDDDLAITSPEGHSIESHVSRNMKTKVDRKIGPAQFPELLKDLEKYEKYFRDRVNKK
jgi:RNA polymerase sigma factor (sigma-70 family)